MPHFSDQLVLFQWGLKNLSVDKFEKLSDMLKAPEFEGWAEHVGSKFVGQIIARILQGHRAASGVHSWFFPFLAYSN